MMKYVLDTSVALKFFIDEEYSAKARTLLRRAVMKEIELIAPELLLFEINNGFVKNGVKGEKYDKAISEIMELVRSEIVLIVRVNEAMLRMAEQIAGIDTKGRGYISSYDASFHAVALMEGALLLTADDRHVRKTENNPGMVKSFADVTL